MNADIYRFKVGEFQCIAVSDGTHITEEMGVIKKANLIVATVNNAAAVNMSINKAAMALIKPGKEITEGLLNRIEMAWRPYDLCLACASHTLPGSSPLLIKVYNSKGKLIKRFPEG